MTRFGLHRSGILLGILLAACGYLMFISNAQAHIGHIGLQLSSCEQSIVAARAAVNHAKDTAQLTAAVVKEVNGIASPVSETDLLKNVYLEAQRIATSEGVVLSDVHPEQVQDEPLQIATPTPNSIVQNDLPCIDDTPTPSPGPGGRGARAARSQQQKAAAGMTVPMQVLPLEVHLHGNYLGVVRAIADFSRARVLLRYSKSGWSLSPTDPSDVTASVTLLVYPPLRIDSNTGQPFSQFLKLSIPASPSPTSSPAGGSS